MFAVIDRLESVDSEQLCQFTSIYAVVLTTLLEQVIVFGIADHQMFHQWLDYIVEPGRMIAFLEGDMDLTPQALEKSRTA